MAWSARCSSKQLQLSHAYTASTHVQHLRECQAGCETMCMGFAETMVHQVIGYAPKTFLPPNLIFVIQHGQRDMPEFDVDEWLDTMPSKYCGAALGCALAHGLFRFPKSFWPMLAKTCDRCRSQVTSKPCIGIYLYFDKTKKNYQTFTMNREWSCQPRHYRDINRPPEIPNIIGSIASRQFRQCWVRRGPIVLRAKKLRLKLVLTDLGQENFSLFVAW